jgi:hypothetical protein
VTKEEVFFHLKQEVFQSNMYANTFSYLKKNLFVCKYPREYEDVIGFVGLLKCGL